MLTIHQKTILLNIAASPFFLAIPITIAIILFLPNPTSKYKIEQKSKNVADKKESKIVFCDLDSDSYDERVVAFHNAVKGEASIKVLTSDGINYDAWNFHGHFQKSGEFYHCIDINEDGFSEIFVFYYRADSVFMGIVQPYPEKKIILQEKFVTTIWKRNGNIDFVLGDFTKSDLNGDGKNELLFLLKAGFSRQPRIIVAYDFFNNTFLKSESFGAFLSNLIIWVKDGSKTPSFYMGSSTPANIPDSIGIPNSDYHSWLFGFDNKLKPLFNPKENPNYPSSVNICKFESDEGQKYIAASFMNNNKKLLEVKFFNSDNKLVNSKEFVKPEMSKSNIVSLMRNIKINERNYILVGIENNEFVLINEKLETIKKDAHKNAYSLKQVVDLNKDGRKEFVFLSSDNEIVIYDYNLNNPTTFKTGILPYSLHWSSIGVKHNGNKQDEYYIKTNNYLYLYSYSQDKLYYLKYPLWLGLYFIIVLVLWLTQRVQNIQTKRKQQIEETINSLQMKTIKSQMDPHFMFNVLNGLAHNVAAGNSNEAYDQILRFSKLLRSLMKKTDKIDISIGEEIEFVTSYLELEKFRFKEDFEFSIAVREGVNQNVRIPRMLIQLLVENAIKHGLRNKEGVKKLWVKIIEVKDQTQIIVEDNGVGRKQAMKTTRDTGKGMKLIKDMIRLNSKLGGREILINYSDLYDRNGKANGTRVEVEV